MLTVKRFQIKWQTRNYSCFIGIKDPLVYIDKQLQLTKITAAIYESSLFFKLNGNITFPRCKKRNKMKNFRISVMSSIFIRFFFFGSNAFPEIE